MASSTTEEQGSGTDFQRLLDNAFRSYETKQCAHALVREEIMGRNNLIVTMEKEIQAWKSRLNTLSDIHKLPDEILAHIFYLLAHSSDPPTAGWTSVAHVCSHWKNVASEYPDLWNMPDFHKPVLASEMIRRAKNAPLIIDFRMMAISPQYYASYYQPRFELIFRQVSRAQSLRLETFSGSQDICTDWLNSILHEPAQLLEHLTLTNISRFVPTLPQKLFSGLCPKLSQISLLNWTLPRGITSSHSFDQITTLSLRIRHENRAPVRRTISFLRFFPRLLNLYLTNFLGQPSADSEPIPQPVRLPHLQKVMITESSAHCGLFFDMVEFPRAQAEVKFMPAFSPIVAEDIVRTVIGRLRQPVYGLGVSYASNDLSIIGDSSKTVTYTFNGFPSTPFTTPSCLFNAFDFTHLRSFMTSSNHTHGEFWRKLGGLTHLEFLAIGWNNSMFFRVWSEISAGSLLFPSLSHLHLRNWIFQSPEGEPPSYLDYMQEISSKALTGTREISINISGFKKALRNRQEYGHYIARISIEGSQISPKHTSALQAITGDRTQWDII